jgi:hypothetical protein
MNQLLDLATEAYGGLPRYMGLPSFCFCECR